MDSTIKMVQLTPEEIAERPITIKCMDGEVIVPQCLKQQWDLFDNRLEGVTSSEEDKHVVEVPFTKNEVNTWHKIACRVSQLVGGLTTYVEKYPVSMDVVCRFFDPRDPYYLLFLKMDDVSMSDAERMCLFVATSNAIRSLYEKHSVAKAGRSGNIWCKTSGPPYFHRAEIEGMREMQSIHPRDIFCYVISKSQCPLDYCSQCIPRRENRLDWEVYDEFSELRKSLEEVNDQDSYVGAIIRLHEVFQRSTRRRGPYDHFRPWNSMEVNVLSILGLDALEGSQTWGVDFGDTPLQRQGRIFLDHYSISGPDVCGEWRVVVRSRNLRIVVDLLIRLGLARAVLDFCELHARRINVNPHLNRAMDLLRERV